MKKLLTLLIITTAMLFSSELLEVDLEANATKEQPLLIKMSLTNISSSDIYVDKESFPFDQSDISRNMFKVKEDEQSIFYTGIKSRGEAKYKLISSGESYSIYIPLSKFYSVQQGTHQYDIVYTDTIAVKYKNIEKLTTLTSNHLEIETTIETKNRPNYKKSKSIKSTCTSSQRTLLHNDLSRSRNVAQKATQLLPASPRYYNFNSTKNTEGWKAGNLRDAYGGPKNGAWFFQVSYNDPQLYSPTLNINANAIKKITIRMANAYNPAQFNLLQVFWKGSGQGFSEANSQVISVHNHGGWMTYTIDLSRNPRWQGNIEQIRIDPLIAGDGHWIAIDSISLTR